MIKLESPEQIECPICGADVDPYDICDNCEWQNSNGNEVDSAIRGPNKMTYKEAKEAYAKGTKII